MHSNETVLSFPINGDMWEFQPLYKYSEKTQKTMIWNVRVDTIEDVCNITRTYGYINSKMSSSVKHIYSGKNIGKKNETSTFQQACNEALSMWNKQKNTYEYTENLTTYNEINQDSNVSEIKTKTVPSPMLAHLFDKHSAKIKYPCYVQPKLDGVRMVSVFSDDQNQVLCYSRTGKPFTSESLKYISNDIQNLYQKNNILNNFYLDGELFTKDLTFEDIVGLCKNVKKPKTEHFQKIKYYVYDIIPVTEKYKNIDFEQRLNILRQILNNVNTNSFVQFVLTSQIENEDRIISMHDEFLSQEYEGIMIRNFKGKYQNNRSYNLQKYKTFTDDEFEITSVKEATGNDEGTAVIQCKTKTDILFWVRPKGSREYRSKLLTDDIIGKSLTVRFQNITEKGVPRFPVGIIIRDYE